MTTMGCINVCFVPLGWPGGVLEDEVGRGGPEEEQETPDNEGTKAEPEAVEQEKAADTCVADDIQASTDLTKEVAQAVEAEQLKQVN